MSVRIRLAGAALLLCAGASAAFEISESALNDYVAQAIARKATRDVQLLSPKVTLQDGYAKLCASLASSFLKRPVDFCADVTPVWRAESGSLHATKMALVSLDAPGVREKDIELLKSLVNQLVLPGLDGVEVYRADSFIGKQLSWLTVLPGRLELGF